MIAAAERLTFASGNFLKRHGAPQQVFRRVGFSIVSISVNLRTAHSCRWTSQHWTPSPRERPGIGRPHASSPEQSRQEELEVLEGCSACGEAGQAETPLPLQVARSASQAKQQVHAQPADAAPPRNDSLPHAAGELDLAMNLQVIDLSMLALGEILLWCLFCRPHGLARLELPVSDKFHFEIVFMTQRRLKV